ncbi:hypothetical protein KY46_12680 [Photobacterium halotolerans]|uniref:Uncharacterized protein n=1 Tax=Photobacterium halotolerans TaxID=265726 RepID=A0A0F5VBM4_9GAMM|nr:hypothetical protein KY46_12680 [Photobacterium halotolerans]
MINELQILVHNFQDTIFSPSSFDTDQLRTFLEEKLYQLRVSNVFILLIATLKFIAHNFFPKKNKFSLILQSLLPIYHLLSSIMIHDFKKLFVIINCLLCYYNNDVYLK